MNFKRVFSKKLIFSLLLSEVMKQSIYSYASFTEMVLDGRQKHFLERSLF